MKSFKHFDTNKIKGKKIILDLDGTFLHDKKSEVEDEYKNIIWELKKENQIYLLSNGAKDRTESIAKMLGVEFIDTEHLKPSKKTLQNFKNSFGLENTIILGDKFLTDGLLALQLNLPFYHVKSLVHKDDNLLNKFIFFVDDIIGQSFDFIKLIRPKQWLKNLLVLSPVFFAAKVFDLAILGNAFLAFFAFTISASFIYIINDWHDMEDDKLHPKKKYRPLAIGNISNNFLLTASLFLLILLVTILSFIPQIIPLIAVYIFTNLLYTFKFKNVPVYDIVLVAFMYLLRIVIGGVATDIYTSPWIIICMFFAALFITSAKRLGELENPTRKVLKYYSKESLTAILISSATLALATYTIHSILIVKNPYAIYSAVIATAIFFVTINDTLFGHKKIESPEVYLMTNRKISFLLFIWLVFEIVILYIV